MSGEVLAATFHRLGITTGLDGQGVLAAAQDVLRPIIPGCRSLTAPSSFSATPACPAASSFTSSAMACRHRH